MSTLGEVTSIRYTNPVTLSLYFTGKDREVFAFLYGEARWLKDEFINVSRAAHFDFDRIATLPQYIAERRDRMKQLLQGEMDDAKVREYWELELDDRVPSSTAWNLSKWGVPDPREIHVRFTNTTPQDDEVYLQVTFMGLMNLPYALFTELDGVGLKYDAIWINDLDKTWDTYSSQDDCSTYYSTKMGLIHDLDTAYQAVFGVDIVDIVDLKQGILWIHRLLVTADNYLHEFLAKRPITEWDDGNARIFKVDPEQTKDYAAIEKLVYYIDSRNDFVRSDIWAGELAAARMAQRLVEQSNHDVGMTYYSFRRLVDWGLEQINSRMAG